MGESTQRRAGRSCFGEVGIHQDGPAGAFAAAGAAFLYEDLAARRRSGPGRQSQRGRFPIKPLVSLIEPRRVRRWRDPVKETDTILSDDPPAEAGARFAMVRSVRPRGLLRQRPGPGPLRQQPWLAFFHTG